MRDGSECLMNHDGTKKSCVNIFDSPSARWTHGHTDHKDTYCFDDYPHTAMSIVITILASIRLFMELTQIFSADGLIQFFTSFNNYIEWACFIMAILFVNDFGDGKNFDCDIKEVRILRI